MASSSEKPEHLFKILVVGDAGAGKTAIIRKYVHNLFSQAYKYTIGVDFALKVVQRENATIRLQLWDIAGQERFGQMTRVYYREALGAFVVFDVTREETFEGVAKWKQDIARKAKLPNGEPIPCVLLANKADLDESTWCRSREEILKEAERLGFVNWSLTSALTGQGLNDKAGTDGHADGAIKMLIDAILEQIKSDPSLAAIHGVAPGRAGAAAAGSAGARQDAVVSFNNPPNQDRGEKKGGCC